MDYETKPVKREELRVFANFFRVIAGYNKVEPIDPLYLLDRIPDLEGFKNVRCEIVYGNVLAGNVPACCEKINGEWVIKIKETTIMQARNGAGGAKMHILHEIVHLFVDNLGFKPIFSRKVTSQTPCYRKLEWIVMALAGEIMMPYEATKGMGEKELIEKYGVSSAAAKKRLKY